MKKRTLNEKPTKTITHCGNCTAKLIIHCDNCIFNDRCELSKFRELNIKKLEKLVKSGYKVTFYMAGKIVATKGKETYSAETLIKLDKLLL
jgi:hypothetical protein